jgi:hypothetical protein
MIGCRASHAPWKEALHPSETAGLTPRLCCALFDRIAAKPTAAACSPSRGWFAVELTYFEIYNECIFDMLAETVHWKDRHRLRAREHPIHGSVTTLSEAVSHFRSFGALRTTAIQNMANTKFLEEGNRDVCGE